MDKLVLVYPLSHLFKYPSRFRIGFWIMIGSTFELGFSYNVCIRASGDDPGRQTVYPSLSPSTCSRSVSLSLVSFSLSISLQDHPNIDEANCDRYRIR